jgi:hypothetical protein
MDRGVCIQLATLIHLHGFHMLCRAALRACRSAGFYNATLLGGIECHGQAAIAATGLDQSQQCAPCGSCIGGADCEYDNGTVALAQGWVQVQFNQGVDTGVVVVACNPSDPSSPIPDMECHGKAVVDYTRQQQCADNFDGYFCESCERGYFRQNAECTVCQPASSFQGPSTMCGAVVALFLLSKIIGKFNSSLSAAERQALSAALHSMWQPCRWVSVASCIQTPVRVQLYVAPCICV